MLPDARFLAGVGGQADSHAEGSLDGPARLRLAQKRDRGSVDKNHFIVDRMRAGYCAGTSGNKFQLHWGRNVPGED